PTSPDVPGVTHPGGSARSPGAGRWWHPHTKEAPMEIVTQVLADGPWHGGYGPPFPFWIFPLVWLLLIGGAVTAVVVRAEPEATCSPRPVAVDPWGSAPRRASARRASPRERGSTPDVAG